MDRGPLTKDWNPEEFKAGYPKKCVPENRVFKNINRGNRIFIGTACGEPQYLVGAMIKYVESNPKAFYDAEVLHVWTLGVAPYTDAKFKRNFRHNSFFIADNTRDVINRGMADYTPTFLSNVPELFERRMIPVDVALIQVSPPDRHGYMSLGVSVDITKTAVTVAGLIIAQINAYMPRVHGDAFIHIDDVDFAMPYDEPLLTASNEVSSDIAEKIGGYVSRIVKDNDTIQVGYGSIPDVIVASLEGKKNLGIHTELLTDNVVALMKRGVINNSKKSINRGKTVATFCMGSAETYEYIHDNPAVDFRKIDYVNSPLVIAQNDNMTAINSALEIDLTGQATATSLGTTFFSGIGGSADFMRGALMARGGKTILVLQSTARNGEISRIVPVITSGAGVTINRGDVRYVVTEYGIAYLHGKNIRERAMDLIAIAHPKFRPWLIEEARERNMIYKDQAYIPGECGEYPENLEAFRKAKSGIELLLRPVRICDETLLKDFFYSLSDNSMYRRFISHRTDMPHERLQDFTVIDYSQEMILLATIPNERTPGREEVVGVGQYGLNRDAHTAEVGLAVRDEYQNMGIGMTILSYLATLAVREGLLGFTAEILIENIAMYRLFEKLGYEMSRERSEGTWEINVNFGKRV